MTLRAETHTSHWGTFEALVEDGALTGIRPYAQDPDPSPLLGNIPASVRHGARIAQPMVRRGWLEHGPAPDARRMAEPFVPVSWDDAIQLLAAELRRVHEQYGPEAIFGGSYGWGSAGRFHNAQGQLHRFLGLLGGYVGSVGSYSNAAGEVILNRIAGGMRWMLANATAWDVITERSDLVVCFGGVPLKNTGISFGAVGRHTTRDHLRRAAQRGVRFVLFSPVRDDLPAFVEPEWLPLAPGSDVAVMLGLAYTLVSEGLHDRAFLDRYTTGFAPFEHYLLGLDDGEPKTPEWAAARAEIPAAAIRDLARRMAAGRTFINVSWSLQRTDHGEQAPWMGLVLAALLGQVGLPGGGYGFGYGAMNYIGEAPLGMLLPGMPRGANPVRRFIPSARIADMLLHPGEAYDFNGQRLHYPDIRLVYWAGGNPFHHHQDLARLRRAFARPETIVVHDPFWTPMARHADIVLPSTITLEREDIGGGANDPILVAMRQAIEPYGEARSDYAIFTALAAQLGISEPFTEGRSEREWLVHVYQTWRAAVTTSEFAPPPFAAFWEQGILDLPPGRQGNVLFDAFRADPEAAPLSTPSGRIEIFSEAIAGFGYPDCPGHPAWLEPAEWRGSPLAARYPLQLVANNPKTRLHSQLDMGDYSQAAKVQGREPARLHPDDAAARGIADGDVIRLYNDRGSCLAGAIVTADIRRGVVQLSTGAWYDPLDPADPAAMCVHGNPNVLTRDAGTSRLAQGCTGQHALVEAERWSGELPPVRCFEAPRDRKLDIIHQLSVQSHNSSTGTAQGPVSGPIRPHEAPPKRAQSYRCTQEQPMTHTGTFAWPATIVARSAERRCACGCLREA